ncbi:MAG: hypothetical protein IT437_09805 [Phycisphaerales bacterium]|nr:hypothetical protein [Phycisphaerales bacterium]
MARCHHHARRGLSLIEVAVSIAAVSVLVVSLGSVVVLSSKAIPDKSAVTPTSLTAGAVTDQITEELRYAIAVSEAAPGAVTFTVPCRDNCGSPDTIRYVLSGSDLVRSVNGKAPVTLLSGVGRFDLSYTKRKVTQNTSSSTTTSSGELLLSKFTGPGSAVANYSEQRTVTGTTWISFGFTIDQVTIPANATAVRITRVTFRGRKPAANAGPVIATVHSPQSAGSAVPGAPVGSPGTLPLTGMTSSYGWVEVPFADAVFSGPISEAVILLKGSGTTGGQVNYMSDTLAVLDNRSMRWTNNSGSTWDPSAALLGTYDMFYNVYGSYDVTSLASTSVDTYYLTNVDLDLQAGTSTHVRTGTHILNEPGVAGP